MGKAAKVTIVEAENIVPVGSIHPDNVHLPGIYVNRIVPAKVEKVIEIRKLREVEGKSGGEKSASQQRRERIARRTAKELKHGYYVNLGVGEYSSGFGSQGLADTSRYSYSCSILPVTGNKGLDPVRKWSSRHGMLIATLRKITILNYPSGSISNRRRN